MAGADRLTIVSMDAHAQMPPNAWANYLPKRFHDLLPKLKAEGEVTAEVMGFFAKKGHAYDQYDVYDFDHAVRNGGFNGLYDRKLRIAEMDREGIAAEFMVNGDTRIVALFAQTSCQHYAEDACHAGVIAYNRWLADEFGPEKDRLKLVGMIGSAPWRTMKEMVAEVDWIADHGFAATSLPGFIAYPGQPPLFDKYWDPYWARVEERGLILWMHAGQGERQGELGQIVQRIKAQVDEEGGGIDGLVKKLADEFKRDSRFASSKPRRAMWQLMMGGVFDRFPKLKLALAEVYGDWIPATLNLLEGEFDAHRGMLDAKRRPRDYWRDHCIVGLSFIRKCEVALRREIGLHNIGFGRDYPHTEGTWPNTKPWLRDALGELSENEIRDILGGNSIRAFGLDGAKLDKIAAEINAPTFDEVFAPGPAVSTSLIEHFNKRCGYLALGEGEKRVPEMRELLREDLWRVGAIA